MDVITAKSAGFCFGVKRAMDKVEEQIEKAEGNADSTIYTYGPIIHNAEVVKKLEQNGVHTIDTDSAGLRAFQDKKEEMRSLLLDAIINSADMRHVREEGLSIEYIYCDKNTGEEVGRFLFDSEDYGQG